MSTRVFIVDDHPIVREGICRLIDNEPDMEICGEADSAEATLDRIETLQPDVAIVDLSLDHSSGFDLIQTLRGRFPTLKVFVLSMHDEKIYAERVLRAGALGYVMKQEAPRKVIDAIRHVARGKVYVSEAIASQVLQEMVNPSSGSSISHLSDRELQVFQFIGEGLTHQDIADRLNLSVKTIESHVERIKAKLHLRSGRELIQRAIEWVLRNQGPLA